MPSPYTLTSRSHLPDRWVRVYRRLRINDGAYGTYQAFQTIIQRYKVRIYPDQHQLRERVPLGEQQRGNAYKALANPSHNGKTIMIGDVFHDVKNNECYDVVAAPRPRAGLSYGAMIQYGLTIVKDGCPPTPTVPYETTPPSGAATAGAVQTLFIMRHFGGDEILGWEALPYFDGVVYNLQYDDPVQLAELAALVAAGRRWWRYYTILDYPFSGTAFGGLTPPLATWFNWLRDNIQFSGSTSNYRLRVADTVALFEGTPAGDGQQRELIAHGLISPGDRAAMISTMVALALAPAGVLAPAAGLFLDQSWLAVWDFQVEDNLLAESGHGNAKEGSPRLTALDYAGTEAAFGEAGNWTTHRAGLMALYNGLAAALGPTRYAIKNGEHRPAVDLSTVPLPWIYENAWNNNIDGANQPERWANAKAGFALDQRNILSIRCETQSNDVVGVPEALEHWQNVGGWISFTDDGSPQGIANREAAYAQAAVVLAARGFPV